MTLILCMMHQASSHALFGAILSMWIAIFDLHTGFSWALSLYTSHIWDSCTMTYMQPCMCSVYSKWRLRGDIINWYFRFPFLYNTNFILPATCMLNNPVQAASPSMSRQFNIWFHQACLVLSLKSSHLRLVMYMLLGGCLVVYYT